MDTSVPQKRWTPPRVPLILLCLSIVVCNLIDALATLHACTVYGAEEMNPLMARLLAYGHTPFLLLKTFGIAAMVTGAAFALHHRNARDGFRKAAFGALIVVAVVYAALAVFHGLVLTETIPLPTIDCKPVPALTRPN